MRIADITTTFSCLKFLDKASSNFTVTTKLAPLADPMHTSPLLTSRIAPWSPSWCRVRRATNESWRLMRVAMAVGTLTYCTQNWAKRKIKRCFWRRIEEMAFRACKTIVQRANSCSTMTRHRSSNRANTPPWWRNKWSTIRPSRRTCLT